MGTTPKTNEKMNRSEEEERNFKSTELCRMCELFLSKPNIFFPLKKRRQKRKFTRLRTKSKKKRDHC